MIDAPHGFTLTTTAAPSIEARPRPLLTITRGPRNAGRAGVTLTPLPSLFGIFEAREEIRPAGGTILYLGNAETRQPLIEVRIHAGADPRAREEVVCFLADQKAQADRDGWAGAP